jgi:hypothetical protein
MWGEKALGKDIIDKFQFVFHKLIAGVIFWITTVFLVSYQQFIIRHVKNELLYFILYIGVFLIFGFFINISSKKSTWKPFGRCSSMIEVLISCSIYLLLICILGFPKVIFRY